MNNAIKQIKADITWIKKTVEYDRRKAEEYKDLADASEAKAAKNSQLIAEYEAIISLYEKVFK